MVSVREEQQVHLDKVAEHVSDQFGLNGDYRITNFKASSNLITLDSVNYEITVKCKGEASEKIHQACMEEYKRIREEKEHDEQFDE